MSCSVNLPIEAIVAIVKTQLNITDLGGVKASELNQKILAFIQPKLDLLQEQLNNTGPEKYLVDLDMDDKVLTGVMNTGGKVTLDLSDLFDDLTALHTTDKSSLVDALNEVHDNTKGVADLYNKNVEAGGINGWLDTFVESDGVNQRQLNDGFENPTQLADINNPRNGQRVYVKSVAAHYIYNSNLTATANGVTVVGKWEMQLRDAYYASWFIADKSNTDNSATLQTAYDYAVSKSKPFIIDVEVHVNPPVNNDKNDKKIGLQIRSNSELDFTASGVIRMLANNSEGYTIINTANAENYVIKNPVIYGDRLTHTGTTGEWGYGIAVYQSKNGFIDRPKVFDCWGDGIYIGREYHLNSNEFPTDITIREPFVSGVRRNGISFTAGNNVNIIQPYITKVGDYDGIAGTYPKAAIDIEPEQATGTPLSSIVNSRITSATIKDCYAGVYVYLFSSNLHHTLTFDGVTTIEGAHSTPLGLFHGGSNCTGLISFEHVLVKPPHYVGIQHGWNGASAIKCVVDRLTILNVNPFLILHTLRGDYTEKVLGNLFVNNITANNAVYHTFETDVSGYTVGNVFRRGANHKGSFVYWGEKALNYAPGFVFDGVQTHSSWTTSTRVYPNTIWQDPSIDTAGTTDIYLNASGDYRRLKVGLLNTAKIIGRGCNIQGLNLLVNNVAKTKAHCLTLGGWLDFQNVEGGRTIIYGSYGDWTFD